MRFDVSLTPGTGYFELLNKESLLASGRVRGIDATTDSDISTTSSTSDEHSLSSDDIYKELSLRGYNYGPAFQVVESAADNSKCGLQCYGVHNFR